MGRLFNIEFVKGFKKTFASAIVQNSYTNKGTLSGKELLSLTPSKQLNFLVMKVLFRQWQEEMKRLESPYFNYKEPEVKKALIQFMNVLSQHIQVSAETLTALLDQSIDQALILVTDPAEFVKQEFSGKNGQAYQVKQAKPILKYLKLLTEEFDDFFNSQAKGTYKEVFEIAEDYFADVDLIEAQEKLFSDLSEITPISLAEVLDEEEFVDITRIDEDLTDFEEEAAPAEEEEVAAPEKDEEPAPETDEKTPDSAEESEIVEEQTEPEVKKEAAKEPEPAPETEETDSEPETKAEEIEPEPTPEPEPAPEPESSPEPEQESSEVTTLNDQFSAQKEESLAERLEKEEPVGSMASSISVNQKYMFVQELFGGDANGFQKAIAEIEHSISFDDAVEHLVTNYAKQHDWDMNSDEVKELLKVIFRKFR